MYEAYLVSNGHKIISKAPKKWFPDYDIEHSWLFGTNRTAEIKTDYPDTGNLFIPFKEKRHEGEWTYSGVLHP